jgi:hypothetical protein
MKRINGLEIVTLKVFSDLTAVLGMDAELLDRFG